MSKIINTDTGIDIHFESEVGRTVTALKNGGVILYPTDTIWGVGCDVFDEAAVRKTFAVKQRDFAKKMVLLVSDGEMLEKYVQQIQPKVHTLHDYHERPVTIIYDHPIGLPSYLLEKDGSVAIRIVKDDFCAAVIQALQKPILSSSANISGEPFPLQFSDISPSVIQNVDYCVDHRRTEAMKNKPSIIARLSDKGEFIFLRT